MIRQHLNHYLQKEYYDSISSIDLDSIECPYCHDHGFSFHAYYIRHIYIFGKKYKIIIDNEKSITSIKKDELLTEMIEQPEDLTHDVDYLIRLLENKEEHLVKF